MTSKTTAAEMANSVDKARVLSRGNFVGEKALTLVRSVRKIGVNGVKTALQRARSGA